MLREEVKQGVLSGGLTQRQPGCVLSVASMLANAQTVNPLRVEARPHLNIIPILGSDINPARNALERSSGSTKAPDLHASNHSTPSKRLRGDRAAAQGA